MEKLFGEVKRVGRTPSENVQYCLGFFRSPLKDKPFETIKTIF